jgi:AcrR family transcriptional regulator
MLVRTKMIDIPDDIRDQLVRTATRMFVKKGFDRTTTRELSKELGWSKGRLYQYVASKNDIIHLLINFFLERDEEFIDTATALSTDMKPSDTLANAIRLYILKNNKYSDLYKVITHISLNLNRRERHTLFESARKVKRYFETLVQRGVEAGEFRTDDVDLVTWNIFQLGDWATKRWALGKQYSVEVFIERMTENVLLQLGASSSPVAYTSTDNPK